VDGVIRHCAYCLNLCGLPAKLCGGCKKRAYCSKECQVKDWSVKGNGQRHVNWCRRHECGEEDVDWEMDMDPIPNKGLGIRAKTFIPAGMKIIVEPSFSSPYDHPGYLLSLFPYQLIYIFLKVKTIHWVDTGINDLQPEGEPLHTKFSANYFDGINNMDGFTVARHPTWRNHLLLLLCFFL